jgi:hypothetical protein
MLRPFCPYGNKFATLRLGGNERIFWRFGEKMNSFLLLEIKTKYEAWCVSCAVGTDKATAEVRTALLLAINGLNDTSPY